MRNIKQLLYYLCYYFIIVPEYIYHPWKKRYIAFFGDKIRVILFRVKLVDKLTMIHVVRGNVSVTKYTWHIKAATWLYSLHRKHYQIVDMTGYDPDSHHHEDHHY